MARAAVVLDDVVSNVIEADVGFTLPPEEGEVLFDLPGFVAVGWSLVGEEWTPPVVEEPPPAEATPLEQVRSDLDWLINYVVTGEG